MTEKKWIKIQFFHMVVTAVIAFILWANNTSISEKKRIAEFNDKSWSALSDFQSKQERLYKKTEKSINTLFENPGYEDWFEKIKTIHNQWRDETVVNVIELKTKIHSYKEVVSGDVDAEEYAKNIVKSLKNPFQRTLGLLDGLIIEKDKLAREKSTTRGGAYVAKGGKKMREFRGKLTFLVIKSENYIKSQWL